VGQNVLIDEKQAHAAISVPRGRPGMRDTAQFLDMP
jgi:hypothetical protein